VVSQLLEAGGELRLTCHEEMEMLFDARQPFI
jgi:hypothetical protein